MKHLFVVNPAAGKENALPALREKVAALFPELDVEFYETKSEKDATAFVKRYCESHPEAVRIYACGGDGTLNEVVSGAIGFSQASVASYPSGSGNDFVKYYGGKDAFFDLRALIDGEEELIDVMQIGDRYAINATHFGFDSAVAKTMTNVRRKKIIGGKNAYTTGVIKALFTAMKNPCRVTVDGELLNPAGSILLCTIANGQYVGGSYRCAPRSLDNDGLLEVCLVRPISIFTFLKLMNDYKIGTHLENPAFAKFMVYRRGKEIKISAPDDFVYSLDGELVTGGEFTVKILPRALKFVVPKGAKPLREDHIAVRPEKAV